MARRPPFTEGIGILGTVGNKETYPVDMFLAGFLTKMTNHKTLVCDEGAANRRNYRYFLAWRCLAYFQRYALIWKVTADPSLRTVVQGKVAPSQQIFE